MIVDCAVYVKGHRQPGELDLPSALDAARMDPDQFVWIGLHRPTDAEFAQVAEEFQLHELAVEDAIHARQRPKLELYDDTLLVVAKTARYDDPEEMVVFSEIQIFVGHGFVVTVRHGKASPLSRVRNELERDPERCAQGPLAVLHAILDRVVDDYTPVIDGLENDLIESEDSVFAPERTNPAPRMYKLKRQVLNLYRAVEPLRDAVADLQLGRHPFEDDDMGPYFRDVEDHLRKDAVRLADQRDMLSDALNVNLAQISVQQNEDMRRISGWAAIAAVPTMLAGIWGMNFDYMPELDERWAYPLAIAVMLGSALFLFRFLRKQGWI